MRQVTYKCVDCGYIYRVKGSAPKNHVECPICGSTKKGPGVWRDRVGKKEMPDEAQDLES